MAELAPCIMRDTRYLVRSDETDGDSQEEPRWLTVWVVTDMESPTGQQLVRDAIKALKKSNQMRLALIYNGKVGDDGKLSPVARFVDSILHRMPAMAIKQTLGKLFGSMELLNADKTDDEIKKLLGQIASHGVDMEPVWTEMNAMAGAQRLTRQAMFARHQVGLAPGDRAVVVNGQVSERINFGNLLREKMKDVKIENFHRFMVH